MRRLHRLLRLRTQLRQLREHEAGALQQRLATLGEEAAAVVRAREVAGEQERLAAADGSLTPAALQLGRDYAETLIRAERAYAVVVAETTRLLAAKREELITSHREESQVRRLEETRVARAAEERARVTAQGLDELAIERHERARRQR
jgi:hypothetical protein